MFPLSGSVGLPVSWDIEGSTATVLRWGTRGAAGVMLFIPRRSHAMRDWGLGVGARFLKLMDKWGSMSQGMRAERSW